MSPFFVERGVARSSNANGTTKKISCTKSKKSSSLPKKSFSSHPHSTPKSRQPQVKTTQLSLLAGSPERTAGELRIEPVPEGLAIAEGRFYVTFYQGEKQLWQTPIQLFEDEAKELLGILKRVSWPDQNGLAGAAVERWIDRRLGVVA